MRRITLPQSVDAFDASFDRFWDRFRGNRALDALFYTASEVGDFGMIWMAMAGVQGAFGPPEQTRHFLRVVGVLGAESIIVNGGLKSLFHRERPAWEQERPMHLRRPRTSSFPSGHSSSAVTAALLLTDANPRLAPLWWGIAGIVAISRVHVKIHHVSDVLGGLAAGALIGTAALRLLPIG
jgi:membrane-associated phospholipid phosphatase